MSKATQSHNLKWKMSSKTWKVSSKSLVKLTSNTSLFNKNKSNLWARKLHKWKNMTKKMLGRLSISKCKKTFLVKIEQQKMRYQQGMDLLLKEESHRFQDVLTTSVYTQQDIKVVDKQVEVDKLQNEMEWWFQWLRSPQRALPASLQGRKNWMKNRNKLHKGERMLLDMAIVDGQQISRVQEGVALGHEARISLDQNQML